MALARLYFAFAGLSAIMMLWVLLRVLSSLLARDQLLVPPPPADLIVAPIVLMMVAKVAAWWSYRREVRSGQP
jgi:hypothetical protein